MDHKQWIGTPWKTLREPHYGIILCTKINHVLHFALVKRRSSYGLVHILRGNLDPKAFAELSIHEKTQLMHICRMDFGWQDIFEEMCLSIAEPLHTDRFYRYLDTFIQNRKTIMGMLQKTPTLFPYGVWGFPKGKRERNETGLECALRELSEETDISPQDIEVCNVKLPVENYNGWLYQYYVCIMRDGCVEDRIKDEGEISDLVWCSFEEALRLIPEVMEQKKGQLRYVYNLMNS